MKLLTRSLATITVLGAVVTAPLLSRLAPPTSVPSPELARAEGSGRLPSDWSDKVVRFLGQRRFPIDDRDLQAVVCHAETAAGRFGLDPFTVLALIEVESGFNPNAVSVAEAKGLMQLREDTAREVAGRLGIPWTEGELLFDPQTNILLGTAYFRELLDRFDDVDVALAAFHAGPARFSGPDPQLGPISIAYTDRVWTSIQRLYQASQTDSHVTETKGDGRLKRA